MSGYKELIEIDPNSPEIDVVDDTRKADETGRVSVGRGRAGTEYEKIILVKETTPDPTEE